MFKANNDYIVNIFLAGWCADAVGSRLEFRNTTFTEEEVFNAMNMIGESTGGTYSGQFTDDSEMEIALLTGIVEGKDDDYFPTEYIANNYIKWYQTEPFDIGQTIRNALLGSTCAEDMINNAIEYNNLSESNGSLMRCMPLALLSVGKTFDQILIMVENEVSLTHSNLTLIHVTSIYCYIISQIIYCRLINTFVLPDEIINNINDILLYTIKNNKIIQWFNEALKPFSHNYELFNPLKNIGHVKHAFIYVIYFLKNINDYTYNDAIKIILSCGGDTDTETKIVGNLFGAYYNNCIPFYMLDPVLNFDCTSNKIDNPYFRRPKEYGVKYGLEIIAKFIDILDNKIKLC